MKVEYSKRAVADLRQTSAYQTRSASPVIGVQHAYGDAGCRHLGSSLTSYDGYTKYIPLKRTGKPMQVQVARWGNSLGLRIPKDVAQRTGLREGSRVDVEAQGDRIIISPARPRYVLSDLLQGMTPEAMREAFDWGPDQGREIVE